MRGGSVRREGDLFQGSSACSSSTGMRTPSTRPDRSASSTVFDTACADNRGQRRQERPLVIMGPQVGVDKDAVASFARCPLQRKRDQVAEPAERHGILAGEQPIVGDEADIGGTCPWFR